MDIDTRPASAHNFGSGRQSLAVAFDTVSFDLDTPELFGRYVANAGLLRALTSRLGAENVGCYSRDRSALDAFAGAAGCSAATARWIPMRELSALNSVAALLWPSPAMASEIWRREALPSASWNIIGTCHSLSSLGIVRAIGEICSSPVRDGDVLVCPSKAALDVVENIFSATEERLRHTLDARRFSRPQLKLIPYGVDTTEFVDGERDRAANRNLLKMGIEDVCLLSVGRLDWRTKQNFLVLLSCCERCVRSGSRFVLVFAGWFNSLEDQRIFTEMCANIAPSVPIRIIIRPDRKKIIELYRTADIFVSVVDNIQESFGIAPVEALAAGLPVVLTDWNGFRDFVSEGRNGYLVPTSIVEGLDLSSFAGDYYSGAISYDDYVSQIASTVIVDAEALMNAIQILVGDEVARRRMGQQSRRIAEERYDWTVVADQYADIITGVRSESDAGEYRTVLRAEQLNPFLIFKNYPSKRLSRLSQFRWTGRPLEDAFSVTPGKEFWRSISTIITLAGEEFKDGSTIGNLILFISAETNLDGASFASFLLKTGLIEVIAEF